MDKEFAFAHTALFYLKEEDQLAQQLANHLKAPCYALSELKAENLYHTVRDEMAKPMKK